MLKFLKTTLFMMGILCLALLLFFSLFKDRGKYTFTYKSSCLASMKTIEGACELYQMENKGVKTATLNDLVSKGYLKTEPKCPPQIKKFLGFISYETYPQPLNIIWPDDTSEISMVDVECPIHGKLSLFK